jgi:hypothetical protein
MSTGIVIKDQGWSFYVRMSLTWATVPDQRLLTALTVAEGFGMGSSTHMEQNYVLFTSVSHIELNFPEPKDPYTDRCN